MNVVGEIFIGILIFCFRILNFQNSDWAGGQVREPSWGAKLGSQAQGNLCRVTRQVTCQVTRQVTRQVTNLGDQSLIPEKPCNHFPNLSNQKKGKDFQFFGSIQIGH